MVEPKLDVRPSTCSRDRVGQQLSTHRDEIAITGGDHLVGDFGNTRPTAITGMVTYFLTVRANSRY